MSKSRRLLLLSYVNYSAIRPTWVVNTAIISEPNCVFCSEPNPSFFFQNRTDTEPKFKKSILHTPNWRVVRRCWNTTIRLQSTLSYLRLSVKNADDIDLSSILYCTLHEVDLSRLWSLDTHDSQHWMETVKLCHATGAVAIIVAN